MVLPSLGFHFTVVLVVAVASSSSFGFVGAQKFAPADNYLVACGSPVNVTVGSRVFVSDAYLSSLNTHENITSDAGLASVSSLDNPALYRHARIFTGLSSYSFSVRSAGRHFIRLHFFPFRDQNYDLSTASFTVSTQDTALMSDFRPTNTSSPIIKEFSMILSSGRLIISFSPSASLAFVNAIEVFSVPDDLIVDGARSLNPLGKFSGLPPQAFETTHRVNMGNPEVFPENDTLWRTWLPDQAYVINRNLTTPIFFQGKINYQPGLATSYTAPDLVYKTADVLPFSNSTVVLFNMTWKFDVDKGSSYLIRLHFCDVVSTAAHELYFNVYVNNFAAMTDFDISAVANNMLAVPMFYDFVLSAKDATSGRLTVSVGPSTTPGVPSGGILNGVEILRMLSSSSSEAASSGSKSHLAVIVGSAAGAIVLLLVVVAAFVVRRIRKGKPTDHKSQTWTPFSFPGHHSHTTGSKNSSYTTVTLGHSGTFGYRFSYPVIQEATNSFNESLVVGVGGFGKVYKGVLKDGNQVAVKRANPGSQQGLHEFRTEIELLSRLRHRHLVSLIGYCDEKNEMILIYEYMEKGTLKSHLYGSDLPALTWKQRLQICIGAARGLHYLHTGSAKAIIHRDVKSANILLDENLMAKVADFGLSKTGPELDQTHVSTAVKGSFGYLDPEYFRRLQLTEKSDVYSFGVVMLEVLCARPVIDPTLPRDMVNLAEWAMKHLKRGELMQVVDTRIIPTISPDSLRKFAETVEKCLSEYGVERPSMGDVLWSLEYVLQLQESADEGMNSLVDSLNVIPGLSSRLEKPSSFSASVAGAGTEELNDLADVSMRRVFSQLIKSEGR